MATTYAEVQRQIKALEAEAEALKKREVGSVIARIKEAIAHYSLTPADLFGGILRSPGITKGTSGKASQSAARYADGHGNTWGGRGPRPQWLREALASGKTLEDFQSPAVTKSRKSKAPMVRRATAKKRGGAPRYRDDTGNTWSGVGRKPRWFVEALAAGKTPEDMAIAG